MIVAPAEMEAPRTRSHPDFLRNCMAVDDDFATIIKLDLQYATSRKFKIQIGTTVFEGLLNSCQRRICERIESLFIHRVTILPLADSAQNMSRIAAILILVSLAACGRKGPLELPPGPAPTPLLSSFKSAPPSEKPPAGTGADVSTPSPTQKP